MIKRILLLGVFIWLVTRWMSLDEKQKIYLKDILRNIPNLPGRYAV